jgi:SAM-dependent methyltransferase
MASRLKKLIPENMRIWIKRSVLKKNIPDYWGGKKFCMTCNNRIKYFNPLPDFYTMNIEKYGYLYKDYMPETLDAKNYLCPHCYCNDRDRLMAYYFSTVFSKIDASKKYTFLDFAPGKSIDRYFRKFPFLHYRTADLMIDQVDDKGVNIESMHLYTDNQFDFFICSHVLEHVSNPDKALRELYRILKPNGQGVLLVPIVLGLEQTHEDPAHTTVAERWKNYGQDDHLRMFGKTDFMNRIRTAGFELDIFDVSALSQSDLARYGFSPSSTLYIAKKK